MLTAAAILCVGVAVEAAGALVDPAGAASAALRGDDAQPARKMAVASVSTMATYLIMKFFEVEVREKLTSGA